MTPKEQLAEALSSRFDENELKVLFAKLEEIYKCPPRIGEAPTYRYSSKLKEKGWNMWRESTIDKYENGQWVNFMTFIDNKFDFERLVMRLQKEGNIMIKH